MMTLSLWVQISCQRVIGLTLRKLSKNSTNFFPLGVRLATYLLALTLIWGAKKAGRVASIVQALFWLLLAICQGFTFGSVVNHDLLGLSWSQPNEILVVVSWILIVLNFIVYCFTDYPPTYVDVKGNFLLVSWSLRYSCHTYQLPRKLWCNVFSFQSNLRILLLKGPQQSYLGYFSCGLIPLCGKAYVKLSKLQIFGV